MSINGMFLVFGSKLAPQVHLLGAETLATFMQRLSAANKLAAKHGRDSAAAARGVYAVMFGSGAECALPCVPQCMAHMALNYSGPHSEDIKRICAAIAIGKPFGTDGKPKDSGQGGMRDKVPKGPKPKSPAPVAVPINASH